MSHLGINPVRGGSPPNDRRVSVIITIIGADLFHRVDNELILVEDDWLSKINIVIVEAKYKIKFRIVSEG